MRLLWSHFALPRRLYLVSPSPSRAQVAVDLSVWLIEGETKAAQLQTVGRNFYLVGGGLEGDSGLSGRVYLAWTRWSARAMAWSVWTEFVECSLLAVHCVRCTTVTGLRHLEATAPRRTSHCLVEGEVACMPSVRSGLQRPSGPAHGVITRVIVSWMQTAPIPAPMPVLYLA